MENQTTDFEELTELEMSAAIFRTSGKVIDHEIIGKQRTKEQKTVAMAAAARAGIAQFFHYAQEIGMFNDPLDNHLGAYLATTLAGMIEGAVQDRLAEIEKERIESN
jgi:hypothetical protein